MNNKLIKLIITSILIISFCFANGIQIKIEQLANSEILDHSQWSVYAEYAENGKVILDHNSEFSLAPASCQKVIPTAIALYYLGENFKYKTKLYYDGEILNNSVLNGNVYIVGSGDPTLGSDKVEGSLSLENLMNEWVKTIKKIGIKKISGSVISDNLLFEEQAIPDDWVWTDFGNYYGTGTSSLCINDNLYYLYFKPNETVGGKAKVIRIEPKIENLKFTNYMKTGKKGSGDNGYIFCAPKQYNAILRGTIPQGESEFSIKGSMPDPALFAAQYLIKSLENNGIEVAKSGKKLKSPKKYDERKIIHITYSPSLEKIIKITNKWSVNLYTEQLLKTVGYYQNGEGSWDAGIDVINDFFENHSVDISGLSLKDGSGLSRTNQVTTQIISKLLSIMSRQKNFDIYYNSFSTAGDKNDLGYLKKFGVGSKVQNNAKIKTGLINGVRSHSGYVNSKSGKLITFSLIVNNYNCSVSEINELHEKVVKILADLE